MPHDTQQSCPGAGPRCERCQQSGWKVEVALEQHSTLPTVNRIETLGKKGTTLSRNHAEMVGTVTQEENLGQRSSEQGTTHF